MSAALAATAQRTADAPINDFAYWWQVPGEWVETPNERRSGWSGMLRVHHRGELVYVKRQCDHLCRTLRHPLGWPTASREWFYLRHLQRLGVCVPTPLFHAARDTAGGVEALLVTAELGGFTPLDAQRDLCAARRRRLATHVGEVLATLHRARLQHGCLYDKHIMVRWHGDEPEVALLDLEKMRRRLTRGAASRHDLDQLRRHQQVWSSEEWRLLERTHAEAL
jgi:hypothetical protein